MTPRSQCILIAVAIFLALSDLCARAATLAPALADTARAPSHSRSSEDGWFDLSGFLDEKFGFLPVILPITEPAVGYGAGVALAFMSRPLGQVRAGFGRPNISAAGGFGTENGTWGAAAGDQRNWRNDRLQTSVGIGSASVNLDFYGIGDDAWLNDHPVRYTLEPKAGLIEAKLRVGHSCWWTGLSYAFAATRVSFETPAENSPLPDSQRDSRVGGLTPSVTYDSRENMFTPLCGTYVEARASVYSEALGGDAEFQRLRLVAIQYFDPGRNWILGLRGEGAAAFGDAPFYMLPFVYFRGVPAMRFQGEEMAQAETELRWQFWKRFSLVGFMGVGTAWNDFEQLAEQQTVVAGGTGFRYELAREYGIHAGLDVGFGPETTAIYVQVGSAWLRP